MRKRMAMARVRESSASATRNRPSYGMLWVPVVIFFLMLSGLAVFYVWERIRLQEISREIVQLQKTKVLYEEENARLRAQVEELTSYRRIYQVATQNFGFVELKPQILLVPETTK